jgi:general secretion pathway protein A
MSVSYRTFFGLEREPFISEIVLSEILETEEIKAVRQRVEYVIRLGGIGLVTGEIGSGKSTALRFATGHLHASEYRVFTVVATSGSILEIYRQISSELGMDVRSPFRAVLIRNIKREIVELVHGKKMKVILVIDEASLMRLEVFAELHTLCQFEGDSKSWLPIILAGQSSLIDKLQYRASLPLASRVIARSHLEGVEQEGMERYLKHHLTLAGVKTNLFEAQAITAIHQGAGGIFRKANHLARGALIAAAHKRSQMVTAEHVLIASTEVF